MNKLDNIMFEEISNEESRSIEGGFIIAYAVHVALVGGSLALVGATVAASAKAGYDAMDDLLS